MTRRLTDEDRKAWDEETAVLRGERRRAPAPVKKPATAQEAAPAPRKKTAPAAPLDILSGRDAERRFKAHTKLEAKIDLHDLTQEEAHDALFGFITRCHAAGKRHVAIITGKGTRGEGVLKRAVPRWLELPQLRRHVGSVAYAPPEKGGEGVLHVLLKKPS